MILAHELAHVRRHDYAVNFVQTVIESLLFYRPGMWWVSNQIRRERENYCDDAAVSVTRALVDVEDRATVVDATTGYPMTAPGEVREPGRFALWLIKQGKGDFGYDNAKGGRSVHRPRCNDGAARCRKLAPGRRHR